MIAQSRQAGAEGFQGGGGPIWVSMRPLEAFCWLKVRGWRADRGWRGRRRKSAIESEEVELWAG